MAALAAGQPDQSWGCHETSCEAKLLASVPTLPPPPPPPSAPSSANALRTLSCMARGSLLLACLGLKSVYPQRNLRHRPSCAQKQSPPQRRGLCNRGGAQGALHASSAAQKKLKAPAEHVHWASPSPAEVVLSRYVGKHRVLFRLKRGRRERVTMRARGQAEPVALLRPSGCARRGPCMTLARAGPMQGKGHAGAPARAAAGAAAGTPALPYPSAPRHHASLPPRISRINSFQHPVLSHVPAYDHLWWSAARPPQQPP